MTTEELRAIAEDSSGDAISRADRFHEVFDRRRVLAMLDVIEAAEAYERPFPTDEDRQALNAALARLKEMER